MNSGREAEEEAHGEEDGGHVTREIGHASRITHHARTLKFEHFSANRHFKVLRATGIPDTTLCFALRPTSSYTPLLAFTYVNRHPPLCQSRLLLKKYLQNASCTSFLDGASPRHAAHISSVWSSNAGKGAYRVQTRSQFAKYIGRKEGS